MKQLFTLFLLLIGNNFATAQVGGDNVYEFLNFSPSARVTSLGGSFISVKDDDIALAYANPSLLNPSMHNQLSFNHSIHLAGINHGFANYGHYFEKLETTFHAGIQYVSYGKFDQRDEYMNDLGEFSAGEYALTLGAGKQLYEKVSLGANLKFITSQFETYNSVGLTADLGAFFQDTSSNTAFTFLLKNIGSQLTTYTPDNREALPFEIQLGFSQKLKYLPFRFGITAHNLQRWNMLYDDPNTEETTLFLGDTEPTTDNRFVMVVDNVFRHLIFSGAFLFGRMENLRLRFAYNHFQKQELSVSGLRSLSGFSFGFGLKIKKFRIEYGRNFYHLAGGNNHFSISTNLSEFRN